jgi:hypothetical protein
VCRVPVTVGPQRHETEEGVDPMAKKSKKSKKGKKGKK